MTNNYVFEVFNLVKFNNFYALIKRDLKKIYSIFVFETRLFKSVFSELRPQQVAMAKRRVYDEPNAFLPDFKRGREKPKDEAKQIKR